MSGNNNAEIGMLIESNRELKSAVTAMSDGVTSLIAFQARAEERHENSSERFEKLEDKVDKLWDKVLKNSLIVNGALIVCSLIIGGMVSMLVGG